MLSAWHKNRSRIAGITWDELRTRATQAVRKRIEFAQHVTGLPTRLHPLDLSRPARGRFFFSTEDLRGITLALQGNLAGDVDKLLQEAEAICEHRFRLLGYESLHYGPEIDWHLDAVHGKRAQTLAWYRVPFLDFSAVGDHKVIWELNRHQHLVTLAKAWVLAHDDKYVAELIRQWYSWRSSNLFPIGINWASSLEVAFRSLSWLWVRYLLAECSAASVNFEQDLLQALALNGDYIEHYLSTYFSPNTHLLGEAVGLFFIGTLCPQLPSAERWQACGLRIVLEQAKRQVRADGVYFEPSLYYHVYALDLFLHFRLLAKRNQIQIPKNFDAILNKMLDVVQSLSQAGPPEGFGDDDGGRVFNPARNRSEHLTDPLALGVMLLGRDDLRPRASLTEEALWLFGGEAASGLRQTSAPLALKSAVFDSAGIYVTASSEPCAQQMVFDAGTMGTGRGGHGHADALSVSVSLAGRRWLVDLGTFCYCCPDKTRDRFRGTAAHNTLLVDGLDQAVPDGPFAWQGLPEVRVECSVQGDTFSLFAANHMGYLRLPDPVLHRRFVFSLHGSFWLVRDIVHGAKPHHLQLSWHFAPDLQLSPRKNSFVASLPEHMATQGPRMALIFQETSGWAHDLMLGEVSPAYGVQQPAQILRTSASALPPTECVTLIIPLICPSDEPGTLHNLNLTGMGNNGSAGVHGYKYDCKEAAQFVFFCEQQNSWTLDCWESDARFLYCATQNGETTHLIVCDGSFAKLNGNSLFSRSSKIERFEWLKKANTILTSASDVEPSGRLT
ncbi:MAG: alginate lyase family protein [Candidatus Sulfotelmatobacter sp.]